ncbi:MAG TPA: hypothetical protein ENH60_02170, partial [Pricia sp.]|nr:hypothetical protein [Pricia sp.]
MKNFTIPNFLAGIIIGAVILGAGLFIGMNSLIAEAGLSQTQSGDILDVGLSAFGGLLVDQKEPQVQIAFNYNINSRQASTTVVGSGTATFSDGLAVLNTTTGANSTSTMESLNVIKYNAGTGAEMEGTAIFTECTAGTTQEFGIGDNEDGIFFGCRDTDFGTIIRRSGSETFTATSSWTGDEMDGFGESGQTIDITKGNVYKIDFQYLGFGAIRYFIEESETGHFILVHTEAYANQNTETSIRQPILPIRMSVTNGGTSNAITIKTGSWAGFSQGKDGFGGLAIASSTVLNVGVTEVPVLSIRATSTFQGQKSRIHVKLKTSPLSTDGAQSVNFFATLNPTLTGANFVSFDTDTSVSAFDSTATALSGGTVVNTLGLAKDDSKIMQIEDDIDLELTPGDILTISAVSRAGTSDVSV